MEREQLTLTGIMVSAIGVILFFGTWIDARYYDPYSYKTASLNGIDLLSSSFNSVIITSSTRILLH